MVAFDQCDFPIYSSDEYVNVTLRHVEFYKRLGRLDLEALRNIRRLFANQVGGMP